MGKLFVYANTIDRVNEFARLQGWSSGPDRFSWLDAKGNEVRLLCHRDQITNRWCVGTIHKMPSYRVHIFEVAE